MRLAFESVDSVKQTALPSVGVHTIQSIEGLNRTEQPELRLRPELYHHQLS